MNNNQKKQYGKQVEDLVEEYLLKNGYRIIAKNFLIRGGEIDIIAYKNNLYTFVEVKYRNNNPDFPLSTIITEKKKNTIIKTALIFMQKNNFSLSSNSIRFDVALVCKNVISYVEDAFTDKETNL